MQGSAAKFSQENRRAHLRRSPGKAAEVLVEKVIDGWFRKMRRWRKKVGYDCRKKVADGRLRIKGKFVTREQVCEQLGIKDIEVYTGDEIK